MYGFELLVSVIGACAFAFSFHTELSTLRLLAAAGALLATVIVQSSPRAYLSLVLGTLSMLGCYHWMVSVAPNFFHIGSHWGVPIWIVFSLYEGSIFFVAKILARFLEPRLQFFALPVSWCVLEVAFPHIIPWHWANLFIDVQPLVLSVAVLGAPFFTLLIFLCCAPANRGNRGAYGAAVALCVLLLCSSVQGRRISLAESTVRTVRVGIVQNNLDPARDFRPEKRFENVEKQQRLSRPLLESKLDLIVWPESAVHFDYPETLRRIAAGSPGHPLPDSGVSILFGTQTRLKGGEGEKIPTYYFSSLMLASDGAVIGRYDKRILLPFSEYVPFAKVLPSLKRVLSSEYELQPGSGKPSIELPSGWSVAVGICYEDLFSSTFADAPEKSVLVSQTNDSWFLESIASEQHYFLSRLRAVEQGKYFVRVTTNGVSAVVSPSGVEVARLPLFTEASMAFQIPLL